MKNVILYPDLNISKTIFFFSFFFWCKSNNMYLLNFIGALFTVNKTFISLSGSVGKKRRHSTRPYAKQKVTNLCRHFYIFLSQTKGVDTGTDLTLSSDSFKTLLWLCLIYAHIYAKEYVRKCFNIPSHYRRRTLDFAIIVIVGEIMCCIDLVHVERNLL